WALRDDSRAAEDGVKGGSPGPVSGFLDEPDRIGECVDDLVELCGLILEQHGGWLIGVPEVFPTAAGGVDDAGEEPVEVTKKIWVDAAWIGGHDVNVVAQGDGGVEEHAVLFRGPTEAVPEGVGHQGIRAKEEAS